MAVRVPDVNMPYMETVPAMPKNILSHFSRAVRPSMRKNTEAAAMLHPKLAASEKKEK